MAERRPWRNNGVCLPRQGAAAKFPKKILSTRHGVLAGGWSYLHHRDQVRHGVEIVSSKFGFSSSLNLPPSFGDLFSKFGLDLWVPREFIQAPRDLSRLVSDTSNNRLLSLTVIAVVS